MTPELWTPVGVESLEPAAEAVVRSNRNLLVLAGPGAGKTELLAQRANFLLETEACRAPRRILAISFKRDAARNLKERVGARCENGADRFDSMTLDAFSKSIVDRFRMALSAEWRPDGLYQPLLALPQKSARHAWIQKMLPVEGLAAADLQRMDRARVSKLFEEMAHGAELPYVLAPPSIRALGLSWWKEQLAKAGPALTFPMLGRLAAFVLRENPKIKAGLRLTYSHVFMDEFQDTTGPQWDVVRTVFAGSDSIVTAVGDTKQRIMIWAGAAADVVDRYSAEFQAPIVPLVRNYRSAPELVRMQHSIALALDPQTTEVLSASKVQSGVCQLMFFDDSASETGVLASLISNEIVKGAIPRDYCVLTRNQVGEMSKELKIGLLNQNVKLRDESALQDLLTEPVMEILMAVLALAFSDRDPVAWTKLLSELERLTGNTEDLATLEMLASEHISVARALASQPQDVKGLPRKIVSLVGEDRYCSVYGEYADERNLDRVVNEIGLRFADALNVVGSVDRLLSEIVGDDAVPAMSIHKSKGLEFKTVIFLGLESEQWFGFKDAPAEEICAFFVAFSRAIERVIFTKVDRRTHFGVIESRTESAPLHDLLRKAGVEVVDLRSRV